MATLTEQKLQEVIEQAMEKKVLDKEKEDLDLVSNPLSWLRFDKFFGPAIVASEKAGVLDLEQDLLPNQRDAALEVQKGIIGGGTKLAKSIAEFVTTGVDATLDTNLTAGLDRVTRDFLKEHGDPDTFVGDITEVVTQYGAPGTLAFKLIGNASKLTKVKNLKSYLDKTLGKIKGKKTKYLATGATTIATRAGQSSLALGAADILASDGDREVTFVDKVDEEGLEGRDLAVARLTNKIKFGQEGAVIGAGIPLLGKGLSLGIKYGLLKPGAKVIGMGAKVADAVVVNPLSKVAARTPFLPEGAAAIKAAPGKLREISGLPPLEKWKAFSVDSTVPLERILKRFDNAASYFKSTFKNTPEAADVLFRGERRLRSSAREIEKLLDSYQKRAYNLAKANEKMYNAGKASPALQDKYLDDTIEFLQGNAAIKTLPKELQKTAKQIDEVLTQAKKEYQVLLPKGNELKSFLEKNLKGYLRKSFKVFTNPNYQVDKNSKIYKDAVTYVKNLKLPQNESAAQKLGLGIAAGRSKIAEQQIDSIINYAKTNGSKLDPVMALQRVAEKQLDMDKFLKTGEELPDVIRKVLGEEKNLRNQVLQTLSTVSTQTANKTMFDRLGDVLKKQKLLFDNAEDARIKYNIAPGGAGIRNVGEIKGLGFLKSSMSKLYGPDDLIQTVTNLKGPLDALAQMPVYKNFLQFKVASQYGKTVLSPATQTRNFSSASFFVINRGLLGGRASVTDSIKMVTDDIFNAGKLGPEAEKRVIDNIKEGIKYGALDENIVAAELGAVLRSIRKGNLSDTDSLTAFLEKRGLLRTASRIYAGGDNVWKWYAYNWYKSFLNDYAKGSLPKMKTWFKNVAGQEFDPKTLLGDKKGLEEAIKEGAAWYVKNTMPTYSLVPRAIQAVRATPLGNFVSFPAEMLRTTANTLRTNLREIASDDVALREMGYRGLMGQFITLGGASMATKELYGAATGITQEMLEKYKAFVGPDFQRNSDIVAITKPENGKFKIVDLSTFFPYDVITRPIRAAFNLISKNELTPDTADNLAFEFLFPVGTDGPISELLEPFINRTIAAEVMSEIANNKKKEGGPIYSELDDLPTKIEKSLKHAAKSLEPGLISTSRQAYYGFRQRLSPTGAEYELQDVLFGLGTGVKPQVVDLKRSMEFKLGDLTKIRTEADDASKMYKFNRSPDNIVEDYIDIQRNAFREQAKVYKALQAMQELGLSRGEILKEARSRKTLSRKTINAVLNGRFLPINYSDTRFKEKVDKLKKSARSKGISPSQSYLEAYPKPGLDRVKGFLNNKSLNDIFPYDVTTDPEPTNIFVEPQKQSSLPTQIQTPPLPRTPEVSQTSVRNVAQINPNTGLTTTETALLSPDEQAIRLRQRT